MSQLPFNLDDREKDEIKQSFHALLHVKGADAALEKVLSDITRIYTIHSLSQKSSRVAKSPSSPSEVLDGQPLTSIIERDEETEGSLPPSAEHSPIGDAEIRELGRNIIRSVRRTEHSSREVKIALMNFLDVMKKRSSQLSQQNANLENRRSFVWRHLKNLGFIRYAPRLPYPCLRHYIADLATQYHFDSFAFADSYKEACFEPDLEVREERYLNLFLNFIKPICEARQLSPLDARKKIFSYLTPDMLVLPKGFDEEGNLAALAESVIELKGWRQEIDVPQLMEYLLILQEEQPGRKRFVGFSTTVRSSVVLVLERVNMFPSAKLTERWKSHFDEQQRRSQMAGAAVSSMRAPYVEEADETSGLTDVLDRKDPESTSEITSEPDVSPELPFEYSRWSSETEKKHELDDISDHLENIAARTSEENKDPAKEALGRLMAIQENQRHSEKARRGESLYHTSSVRLNEEAWSYNPAKDLTESHRGKSNVMYQVRHYWFAHPSEFKYALAYYQFFLDLGQHVPVHDAVAHALGKSEKPSKPRQRIEQDDPREPPEPPATPPSPPSKFLSWDELKQKLYGLVDTGKQEGPKKRDITEVLPKLDPCRNSSTSVAQSLGMVGPPNSIQACQRLYPGMSLQRVTAFRSIPNLWRLGSKLTPISPGLSSAAAVIGSGLVYSGILRHQHLRPNR